MKTLERRINDLELLLQQPDENKLSLFQVRLDSAIDPARRWNFELVLRGDQIEVGMTYGEDFLVRMITEDYQVLILDRAVGRVMDFDVWQTWRAWLDSPRRRRRIAIVPHRDRTVAVCATRCARPGDVRKSVENAPAISDETAQAIDRLFAQRDPYHEFYRTTWRD